MLRFLCEIGEFAWIAVMIVEFAAGLAFIPLGVAPARCAQAVAEEARAFVTLGWRGALEVEVATAHDLRQRPAATDSAWVFEHGHEALALQIRGCFDSGEFSQRGIEIEVAHGGLHHGALACGARGDNEQRHAGAAFKEALLLP